MIYLVSKQVLPYSRCMYRVSFIAVIVCFTAIAAFAQGPLVINDPTKDRPEVKPAAAQESVLTSKVFPKITAKLKSDTCSAEPEILGSASGAFTRKGVKQTIVFYQICETGNGLGMIGLTLLDGSNKVIGSYYADSGWGMEVIRIDDVNRNGIDEFALFYGGGMHGGHGGIGMDIFEFSTARNIKGLGWYKAAETMDGEPDSVWKLSATPGSVPKYFTQKFNAAGKNRYRSAGRAVPARLKANISTFEELK